MLALVAAILLLLVALGIDTDAIDLFNLALAFWAAHFAFAIGIPRLRRSDQQQ
jgi:hypothetical protein